MAETRLDEASMLGSGCLLMLMWSIFHAVNDSRLQENGLKLLFG